MSGQLKSPAAASGEAKTRKTKAVSDYESPLSREKVIPVPKYPVMALGHMAFDPLIIRGEVKLRRLSGTPTEGMAILVEYDETPCLITIHRLDSPAESVKGED